jgi:hypothetical protein
VVTHIFNLCRSSFVIPFHVGHILSLVNQRFNLLNHLSRQGLDSFGLNVVFNALVISKFMYACQAFSGFLSSSDMCRLQRC